MKKENQRRFNYMHNFTKLEMAELMFSSGISNTEVHALSAIPLRAC